jgi:hypothetical protein
MCASQPDSDADSCNYKLDCGDKGSFDVYNTQVRELHAWMKKNCPCDKSPNCRGCCIDRLKEGLATPWGLIALLVVTVICLALLSKGLWPAFLACAAVWGVVLVVDAFVYGKVWGDFLDCLGSCPGGGLRERGPGEFWRTT